MAKGEILFLFAGVLVFSAALRIFVDHFASSETRRFLTSEPGLRPTGPDGSYVRGDYFRGAAKLLLVALVLIAISTVLLIFVVGGRPVQDYPYLAHLYSIVFFALGVIFVGSGLRYLYVGVTWRRPADDGSG